MTPSNFELNYDLTSDDIRAWKDFWHANFVSKMMQHSRAINLLAVALGAIIGLAVVGGFRFVVWAAGLTWDPMLYWLYFYGVIGGIIVTFVVFRSKRGVFHKKLMARLSNDGLSEKDKAFLGPRTLKASADDFTIESPFGSTTRKWNAVNWVHVADAHVFIQADVIVVVPRTAFASEAECDQFIEAVQDWSQQNPSADDTAQ